MAKSQIAVCCAALPLHQAKKQGILCVRGEPAELVAIGYRREIRTPESSLLQFSGLAIFESREGSILSEKGVLCGYRFVV